MITIVFPLTSRININNVPPQILSIARMCDSRENQPLIVYTNISDLAMIHNLLNSLNIASTRDGEIITVIGYAQVETQADVQRILNAGRQVGEIPDVIRTPAQMPAQTPGTVAVRAPQPVVETPMAFVEHVLTDEVDQDDQENIDDENEDEVERNDPMVELETKPFTKEILVSILPSIVPAAESSQCALCNQKINEFNRMWGNVLQLKRQIDDLMKVINSKDILKKMEDDILYLQEKCSNDIDSIGIDKNCAYKLIIKTKEIITEDQPEYGRRRVGRLQIVINLLYIYAQNPPDTNFIKSFSIRNLDRCPNSCVCGHAFGNNDGYFEVCLGGYFNHIFDAIVSKNLPLFFDTLLRFVKSPNEHDSWGKNIRFFPEVIDEA